MLVDSAGKEIKQNFTIIPLDFIKAIPYDELCLICRRLAMAVVNGDAKAADNALIQLLMEVDMAGKIKTLKMEGKHEEAAKLEKEQQKKSRDNF